MGFFGIERGFNRCCLVPFSYNDRSRESLVNFTLKQITSYMTILNDGWLAFRNFPTLPNHHYAHNWVVHKYNFVYPRNLGIQTQTVDKIWSLAKSRFRNIHGTSPNLFDTHLHYFTRLRAYPESAFANIIFCFRHYYDINCL